MCVRIRRSFENGNDTSIIFGTFVCTFRDCEWQTEREKKEMNFTFCSAAYVDAIVSCLVISHTSVSMQILFHPPPCSRCDWCVKYMLKDGGAIGWRGWKN